MLVAQAVDGYVPGGLGNLCFQMPGPGRGDGVPDLQPYIVQRFLSLRFVTEQMDNDGVAVIPVFFPQQFYRIFVPPFQQFNDIRQAITPYIYLDNMKRQILT